MAAWGMIYRTQVGQLSLSANGLLCVPNDDAFLYVPHCPSNTFNRLSIANFRSDYSKVLRCKCIQFRRNVQLRICMKLETDLQVKDKNMGAQDKNIPAQSYSWSCGFIAIILSITISKRTCIGEYLCIAMRDAECECASIRRFLNCSRREADINLKRFLTVFYWRDWCWANHIIDALPFWLRSRGQVIRIVRLVAQEADIFFVFFSWWEFGVGLTRAGLWAMS